METFINSILHCVQDLYQKNILSIDLQKTLSGRLQELKNKGKVKLGNRNSGHGHL